MRKTKFLKPILFFFIAVSFFSCKNNDESQTSSSLDLIGTWQRSDVTEQFEYTLSFQTNEIGSRIVREENDDGQIISSARSFNWTTNDMVLTLDYGDDVDVSSFSFNADGQLFLNDLTDLHFTKIEE